MAPVSKKLLVKAMSSVTHPTAVDYQCIYAEFEGGGKWGFVKRSNGNWNWSRMDYAGDLVFDPKKQTVELVQGYINNQKRRHICLVFKPTFIKDLSGKTYEKRVPLAHQYLVTMELFKKIFPYHPTPKLVPFEIAGDEVDKKLKLEFEFLEINLDD